MTGSLNHDSLLEVLWKLNLTLPELYLITGDEPSTVDAFIQQTERCLQRGIRLLQLRSKQLPASILQEIAKQIVQLAHRYQAEILFNSSLDLPSSIIADADGIHLTAQSLLSFTSRPVSKNKLVAASCHNRLELQHAMAIGVDFVTLCPVLPTLTHPGAKHLGWDEFASLCQQYQNLPIYALGGVSPAELSTAQGYGGHGIAGIRNLWYA